MIDSLYKEEILEHFHDPQNFGELTDFTKKSKQLNPFCGDEIEMFVKIENNGSPIKSCLSADRSGMASEVIEDISFVGKGCAISIASASMLTEFVKGKTRDQISSFSDNDMISLLEIEISETRKKCALLGLAVLKDCII